jgi:hypothetical protein
VGGIACSSGPTIRPSLDSQASHRSYASASVFENGSIAAASPGRVVRQLKVAPVPARREVRPLRVDEQSVLGQVQVVPEVGRAAD